MSAPGSELGTGGSCLPALLEQVMSAHLRLEEEHAEEVRRLRAELDLQRRLHPASPSSSCALKSRNKIRTGPPTGGMLQECTASPEPSEPSSLPRAPDQDAVPPAQGAAAAKTQEKEGVEHAAAFEQQEGEPRRKNPGVHPLSLPSLSSLAELTSAVKKKQKTRRQHSLHRGSQVYVPSENRILRFVEKIVRHPGFDIFFSALIGMNALVMAFELEFKSGVVAGELGYEAEIKPADYVAKGNLLYAGLSVLFGGLFTVEIVLRAVAQRRRFPRELWNWVDSLLVIIWLYGFIGKNLPINPMVLRLLRFAKLARMLRLVRRFQGFDALFLMTTAMKSSLSILLWTTCLLCVLMLLLALLAHEVLMEFYLTQTHTPFEERLKVYGYFGTFTKSLFSMFELTLANWPVISRALIDNVSGWFIVYTIGHKLVFGFALLGIINGVFIQETFKMAQSDDEVMMRKARLAAKMHAQKMEALVTTVDVTGRCLLDIQMFRHIFNDPSLKSWLSSQELSPEDADTLFEMMDSDGSGQLTLDEVITGVAKYKGTSRAVDVKLLLRSQQRVESRLAALEGPPQGV